MNPTLTTAQLLALKSSINADPAFVNLPNGSDQAFAIAAAYNLPASPDFMAWNKVSSTVDIMNKCLLSQYTPNGAAAELLIDGNRCSRLKIKQDNLFFLMRGETFDATQMANRASLLDAITALPSGANGAPVNASQNSGNDALAAALRKATRAEKVLSTGSATTGTTVGNLLGAEGELTIHEIIKARAS